MLTSCISGLFSVIANKATSKTCFHSILISYRKSIDAIVWKTINITFIVIRCFKHQKQAHVPVSCFITHSYGTCILLNKVLKCMNNYVYDSNIVTDNSFAKSLSKGLFLLIVMLTICLTISTLVTVLWTCINQW